MRAARWRPGLPQPAMTPAITSALAGAIVRGPANATVPSWQAAAVPGDAAVRGYPVLVWR